MPVYLVGRGPKYTRTGLDDVGDIYEVFEGPEPPGGTGYELAEVVEIKPLSREVIEAILASKKPVTDIDHPSGKEHWLNSADSKWYEVVIKPSLELNFADFTLQDKAILINELSTSEQQILVLNKIRANIAKYPVNTQTLKS